MKKMIAFLSYTFHMCVCVNICGCLDVFSCFAPLDSALLSIDIYILYIHISHIFWLQKPIGSARHTHIYMYTTWNSICFITPFHGIQSQHAFVYVFCFDSIRFFFVVSIIEANESNNKFNTLETFRYIRDKGNVKIFLFFLVCFVCSFTFSIAHFR